MPISLSFIGNNVSFIISSILCIISSIFIFIYDIFVKKIKLKEQLNNKLFA